MRKLKKAHYIPTDVCLLICRVIVVNPLSLKV